MTLWVALASILASLVIIGGAVAAWSQKVRPKLNGVAAFAAQLGQTVLGREAERDAYGRETSPAIPPLAEQVAGIRTVVDGLVARDERLTALETTVAEHGQRLTAIEAGHQFERALGHVAQGKVVDAIAEANRRRDDRVDTDQEG